jgi:hypothetical protein
MPSRDEILRAAYDGSWNQEHKYLSSDGTMASNQKNCVGFVKSVARAVGVFIPDNRATFVTNYLLHSNSWIELKDKTMGVNGIEPTDKEDAFNGVYAKVYADYNYLVLAAREDHVAVVVPGPMKVGKYPLVWCGSTDVYQSQGDKSVLDIWGSDNADRVQYFYCPRAIFTG